MSRKRLKTTTQGPAPWLNTFADLMNLLLCFFVMIFAFSDINAEKFEKVSISMANSFGITKNTTNSEVTNLIGSGMTQLNELDQYYNKLSELGNNSSKQNQGDTSQTDQNQTDISKALETLNKEMEAATAAMYDKISDLTEQYQLSDDLELSIDPDHKYVELTMKGSVLYNSGEANIKKSSLPILQKIGDVLKHFKEYDVEIIGYTDNIPITSNAEFKDNNWLSSARALNAAEYLINECNMDPARLKYSGRGEYDPIASNATEEGRAENRRIEFKIFNEYSSE